MSALLTLTKVCVAYYHKCAFACAPVVLGGLQIVLNSTSAVSGVLVYHRVHPMSQCRQLTSPLTGGHTAMRSLCEM